MWLCVASACADVVARRLRRFEFFLWVFMLVLYFVPKGIGQGQYELYPLLVLHLLLLLYPWVGADDDR